MLQSSDIKFYRSKSGTDTYNLGGPIDLNSDISLDDVLHNLFDMISGEESERGDHVDYRCFYVKNDSDTDTLVLPKVFILDNNPEIESTVIGLGLGSAGISGSEPAIAEETSVPVSVTFVDGVGGITNGSTVDYVEGKYLTINPELKPQEFQAIWFRRTIGVNKTTPKLSDGITLEVRGSTFNEL